MEPQEFADAHNVHVAMDSNGNVRWHETKPRIEGSVWWNDLKKGFCPPDVVYPKDTVWRDSLVSPKWRPKDAEPVACWDEGDVFYYVFPYGRNTKGSVDAIPYEKRWGHVSHYSGQLDMHVEALKDEPRLK